PTPSVCEESSHYHKQNQAQPLMLKLCTQTTLSNRRQSDASLWGSNTPALTGSRVCFHFAQYICHKALLNQSLQALMLKHAHSLGSATEYN
ncbi:hypothetical protein, partial [Vibrio cholerae]|uniref:hypothetical protein n=1 Tax=Vibrio cholerae TaxID=666 RepID=UPI001A7E5338